MLHISLFIKIKIKLLSQGLVLLMHPCPDKTNFTLSSVVDPTVRKNEFHVLHIVLNFLVLMLLKLSFDGLKVHRNSHNRRVVQNAQLHPVNRFGENLGFLIASQSCEHSLGCQFPLLENGCAFGHLGHL